MDAQAQTCVVDATTLTDHVHEIKKLVYDGRIRVMVPVCTFESVENIYQKSIEPKPEPKEAARPKSSGKPVKVYPTFDINPRIAREFLHRCKTEDSKLGVEFQQAAEEYTPWRNLKEQEEKQKAPDAKPAGYAAALLAKLNDREAPVQTPRGPMKPKLVARSTNGPISPWKRSVPIISAEGIPTSLRSILGYTLWRLHERETYSFAKDASILLTNDPVIGVAAKKLGINVQGVDLLLRQISSQTASDANLNSWGEVERHFGVRPPSMTASRNGQTKSHEEIVSDVKSELAEPGQLPALQDLGEVAFSDVEEHEPKKSESPEPKTVQQGTTDAHVSQSENNAPSELEAVTGDCDATTSFEKEQKDGDAVVEAVEQAKATPPKPRAWADVVSNRIRPIEERYPLPVISTTELSDTPKDGLDTAIDPLADQVNQDKANTIADWVRMVKANMDSEIKPSPNRSSRKRSPKNKKMDKSSPSQEPSVKPFRPILMQRTPKSSQAASDKAQTSSEKAHSTSPPLSVQPVEQTVHIVEPPPKDQTEVEKNTVVTPTTPPAEHAQNIAHHRSIISSVSSTQSVPSKDTSDAKTAPFEEPVDSEEEVVVFNPRAKRLSAQQQAPKASSEEKPVNSKRVSVEEPSSFYQPSADKAASPKQNRPRKPKVAPIVIDPDAFGRDFASNPQMNHQNGFHRPHSRPVSQHGPLRPVVQNGPPRGGGGARGGRPFIHPQALPPMQNGQHGHLNANVRGGRQNRIPPASAQNGYTMANQNNVAVNGHVATRPSPRPSPRGSPQRLAQTSGPDPDVEFVLQSGPPRGSSRGRGKLWIP